jgi:hypothetical protein
VYRLLGGVDLAVMPYVVYHLHSVYNPEGRLRRGVPRHETDGRDLDHMDAFF